MFANYYANIDGLCPLMRWHKWSVKCKSLIVRGMYKVRAGKGEHAVLVRG